MIRAKRLRRRDLCDLGGVREAMQTIVGHQAPPAVEIVSEISFLIVCSRTVRTTSSPYKAALKVEHPRAYSTTWECVRVSGVIHLVKSLGTSRTSEG